MAKSPDLTGKSFGKLKVVRKSVEHHGSNRKWECICDCGKKTWVTTASLTRGTKSCGCLVGIKAKETFSKLNLRHGQTTHGNQSGVWRSWKAMMDRCYRERTNGFKNYGGRGIRVCERWHVVDAFLEDMGARPVGHVLDRIDFNTDYSPENCRWVSAQESSNNKRNTIRHKYKGEFLTTRELSNKYKIPYLMLKSRLYLKWTIQDAIERPPYRVYRRHKNGTS